MMSKRLVNLIELDRTCSSLQKARRYVILTMCLSHGKGGHDDRYGRTLNGRGGCSEAACLERYRLALATQQGARWCQDCRCMAHHATRLARVHRQTAQRE